MNVWQKKDKTNGLTFPYYVHELLDDFENWNMSGWKVFEYGGGDSTLWWRDKCRECISIDNDKVWARNRNLIFIEDKEQFVKYPLRIVEETNEKFDCIIIDQGRGPEGESWRDECTEIAVECLKDSGVLIIDNWLQDSIPGMGRNDWKRSQKILSEFKGRVYTQHNHKDWKTAVWYVNKKGTDED